MGQSILKRKRVQVQGEQYIRNTISENDRFLSFQDLSESPCDAKLYSLSPRGGGYSRLEITSQDSIKAEHLPGLALLQVCARKGWSSEFHRTAFSNVSELQTAQASPCPCDFNFSARTARRKAHNSTQGTH